MSGGGGYAATGNANVAASGYEDADEAYGHGIAAATVEVEKAALLMNDNQQLQARWVFLNEMDL
jgi:hypothetical protein